MNGDSSGDYIIAGEIWGQNESSNDIFIVKINETFSINATWGGSMQEEFSGMVVNSNDSIYISGTTTGPLPGEKDAFLVKYNNNLTEEWSNYWGDVGLDYCSGIAVDSQDNVYLSGMTNYPNFDVFLLKYNNSGSLEWNRTWSTGSNITSEIALPLVIDSMDQIFLGVQTNFTGLEWILLKYNSSGNLLNNSSFSKYNPIEQLALDSSDNLYALGSYNVTYLTKFDNEGNVEWNLTCILNVLKDSEILAVDSFDNVFVIGNELINDSAIIYGYNMTDYDTYLMNFNESGHLNWNSTMYFSHNFYPDVMEFDTLGNIYLGGTYGMFAPGSLGYSVIVYDNSGNPRRFEGGACSNGDSFCKGIYAESPTNFVTAENIPCGEGGDYDIRLVKYGETDFSHCRDPNPMFLLIHQIVISLTFIILGISYLVWNDKRQKNQPLFRNKRELI
jgi:hypothetical protein